MSQSEPSGVLSHSTTGALRPAPRTQVPPTDDTIVAGLLAIADSGARQSALQSSRQPGSTVWILDTRDIMHANGQTELFCLVDDSTHKTEYSDYLRFKGEGYKTKVEPEWHKVRGRWVAEVQWVKSWISARHLNFR
jgi:hypothetical protein